MGFTVQFQEPINLCGLKETRRHRIPSGNVLEGLCHSDEKMFTVEWKSGTIYPRLCMYLVQKNNMKLLGKMELLGKGEWLSGKICSLKPCIERHSQRIFVACVDGGVIVARFDGRKLIQEKVLRGVKSAVNMVVISPDTICVVHNDGSKYHANYVNIESGKIITSLAMPKPEAFQTQTSAGERLAVYGDSVIIFIPEDQILVYREDGRTTRLPWPEGLSKVSSIRTDKHGHILVTDPANNIVFVLDSSGRVHARVEIQTDGEIQDCAVIDGQLWVGCYNGEIIIMSPESP